MVLCFHFAPHVLVGSVRSSRCVGTVPFQCPGLSPEKVWQARSAGAWDPAKVSGPQLQLSLEDLCFGDALYIFYDFAKSANSEHLS